MAELRYQDFLSQVVEQSSNAAVVDYTKPEDKHMLEGSLAGLAACLDKSPPQLAELLTRAHKVHGKSFHSTNLKRYWRVTCFLHEVEWVCNVISCVLVNMGVDPIIPPTMRGALMAQRITHSALEPN